MVYTHEVTREQLEEAARECLTQPDNCAMWDDRLYKTHGPVYSWADRGDDVLDESNFHTILADLQGYAREESDDVFDGSVSHWLVGSLQQIWVRVYDEDGDFTPAFVRATEIAHALRDYPVFDESDWSERELEVHEEYLRMALDDAVHEWAFDSEEESAAIRDAVLEESRFDTFGYGDDLSWTLVAEGYAEARDAYFEARVPDALENMRAIMLDGLGYSNPDQTSLFD